MKYVYPLEKIHRGYSILGLDLRSLFSLRLFIRLTIVQKITNISPLIYVYVQAGLPPKIVRAVTLRNVRLALNINPNSKLGGLISVLINPTPKRRFLTRLSCVTVYLLSTVLYYRT